jgi:hypothetical protein
MCGFPGTQGSWHFLSLALRSFNRPLPFLGSVQLFTVESAVSASEQNFYFAVPKQLCAVIPELQICRQLIVGNNQAMIDSLRTASRTLKYFPSSEPPLASQILLPVAARDLLAAFPQVDRRYMFH